MIAQAAPPAAGTELSYHCPMWAFDRKNPDQRPRTGGKWQPMWVGQHGQKPMPGFETYVDQLLRDLLQVLALYEPLRVALPRRKRASGGNRQRRFMCNDFFLPEYELLIEIYSGCSERAASRKLHRLQRANRMTGIRYLLLTPKEWALLIANPDLLGVWIYQAILPPRRGRLWAASICIGISSRIIRF